jgi:23S rRNA (guanosine2251-2'-O)-methyltransferase
MKNWLWGWHVFESVIKNKKRKILKVATLSQHMQKVQNLLKHEICEIEITHSKRLDDYFGTSHQGIVFETTEIPKYNIKEWLNTNFEKDYIVACDLIEDPQNLGAIMRSAKALGANAILLTKIKRAPLNGTLAKAAAGALDALDIIEVSNLATSLSLLQENQYTILGLDEKGNQEWPKSKKIVLVLGQEGSGLRPLTKKMCDDIISINANKDFSTLNVSVAAAIAMSKLFDIR